MFPHSFCKTAVRAQPSCERLGAFHSLARYFRNDGGSLDFPGFLRISKIINKKKQFRPVYRYLLQNSISIVSWERLGALHSLATFRRKRILFTGIVWFLTNFNTVQRYGFFLFSFCSLGLFPHSFCKTSIRARPSWERLGAFPSLSKYLRNNGVSTGFLGVCYEFQK